MPADLAGWLSYLEKLHPKSIALGLGRVQLVRERMALAPEFTIITVAGTNGKGSTCAILERILSEAGYAVACYTSPHLLRYNERVRINGKEAGDDQLCRAFAAVEAARGDVPLTYFEFGTLAAVWLFVEAGVDVAVLEIGLGGRLDAVNAFEPDCAIVTSIDMDHMDYLGDSREAIGFEKAGVYRSGIPAICGDIAPPTSVTQVASTIGADYRQIGHDFGYELSGGAWSFWTKNQRIDALPLPALSGAFQLDNAACVLEALTSMADQFPVTFEQIHAGLVHVTLSGRYQQLQDSPQIIVDVAHNPHAARGFAGNLQQDKIAGRTIAVFAMLADKDIAGVVEALHGEIDEWLVAGIAQPRGASASQLVEIVSAHAHGVAVSAFDNVAEALAHACRCVGENDRIAAFGSFYTVADVLRALPTNGIS
jgi:dihydrofolate synthase/folylpolyglutamate synthase